MIKIRNNIKLSLLFICFFFATILLLFFLLDFLLHKYFMNINMLIMIYTSEYCKWEVILITILEIHIMYLCCLYFLLFRLYLYSVSVLFEINGNLHITINVVFYLTVYGSARSKILHKEIYIRLL